MPITLNYDRVYESNSFPFELLGESQTRENAFRTLKSAKYLNRNNGRVCINISTPLSLRQELASRIPKPLKDVTNQEVTDVSQSLATDICCILSANQVVMSTQIVAAILLMHRKGISEDELLKETSVIHK